MFSNRRVPMCSPLASATSTRDVGHPQRRESREARRSLALLTRGSHTIQGRPYSRRYAIRETDEWRSCSAGEPSMTPITGGYLVSTLGRCADPVSKGSVPRRSREVDELRHARCHPPLYRDLVDGDGRRRCRSGPQLLDIPAGQPITQLPGHCYRNRARDRRHRSAHGRRNHRCHRIHAGGGGPRRRGPRR